MSATTGVTRVETQGSWWELDDGLSRYRRMPKEEKPRPNGWGGPEAGRLQDFVWHPMLGWAVNGGRLRIATPSDVPDHVQVVGAPLTTEEMERRGWVNPFTLGVGPEAS